MYVFILWCVWVCVCAYICTERLDEILASQESAMRPQVEADYRAATVKQRPTSRRITPAEISVRYRTDVHNYATISQLSMKNFFLK